MVEGLCKRVSGGVCMRVGGCLGGCLWGGVYREYASVNTGPCRRVHLACTSLPSLCTGCVSTRYGSKGRLCANTDVDPRP